MARWLHRHLAEGLSGDALVETTFIGRRGHTCEARTYLEVARAGVQCARLDRKEQDPAGRMADDAKPGFSLPRLPLRTGILALIAVQSVDGLSRDLPSLATSSPDARETSTAARASSSVSSPTSSRLSSNSSSAVRSRSRSLAVSAWAWATCAVMSRRRTGS